MTYEIFIALTKIRRSIFSSLKINATFAAILAQRSSRDDFIDKKWLLLSYSFRENIVDNLKY